MPYRKYNWPALFEQFESSGLTQAKFCEEQNIDPNYFSSKRRKAIQEKQSNPNAFVAIEVQSEADQMPGLALQVGRCKVLCPQAMSLESLATLVRILA